MTEAEFLAKTLYEGFCKFMNIQRNVAPPRWEYLAQEYKDVHVDAARRMLDAHTHVVDLEWS